MDTLKIDRAFIAGLDQNSECRAIVRTILNLAETLKLDVIAEGVETLSQLEYLQRLGCGYGQGRIFSGPLAVEDLKLMIGPWSVGAREASIGSGLKA